MSFETGDVVRVPFPYVEANVRRYRPALVVTRAPVGPGGLLIWAVMITNAQRQAWPGDLPVTDLGQAGLPIPSVIRTAKLATLETGSAERIGRVSDNEIAAVLDQMRQHLGLR